MSRMTPPRITGRTTVAKFQELAQKMVIKDRIQRFYADHAHAATELRKVKREHGYCGGSPSCLVFTGEARLCERCLKAEKNPRYKRPVFEYGKIRAKERKDAREAKESKRELKRERPSKREKTSPQRKAA